MRFGNAYMYLAAGLSGEKIFFIRHGSNEFMYLDLQDCKIKYIQTPKGFKETEWQGAHHIISEGDFLYIKEHFGKNLVEYSIKENKCRYIDLKGEKNNYSHYSYMTKYNDCIYLISAFSNELVRVYLATGKIEKEYIVDKSEMAFKSLSAFPSFSCCYRDNDILWLFSECGKYVMKYCLNNGQKIVKSLFCELEQCIDVAFEDGIFYLLDKSGDVFLWNKATNYSERIITFEQDVSCSRIICTEKRLWIFPSVDTEIYFYDKEKKNVEKYEEYPQGYDFIISKSEIAWSKYYHFVENEEYYFLSMQAYNKIVMLEKKTGKCYWIDPILPSEEEELEYVLNNKKYPLRERSCLVKNILRLCEERIENPIYQKDDIGETIWNVLNYQ